MIEVNTADGVIKTDLPPEAVKDLEVTPEVKPEPVKVEEPVKPAVEPKAEDKPQDPPKVDPKPTPEAPRGKAKPIANLLAKNHELSEALAAREARIAELEAATTKPAPEPQKAEDEIAALAQKHGVQDPSLIKDIIETARKGLTSTNPAIPKEVQDLLAERQAEKEHQAELSAFNTRADKLATVFKDEPIAAHKDKILELAYSTEKAPDGERYCDKELSEIYFGFIKPTIEPGKVTAEPSRGGTQAGAKVVDYEEIMNDTAAIEAMTSEEFQKFDKWLHAKQGDVPVKHSR